MVAKQVIEKMFAKSLFLVLISYVKIMKIKNMYQSTGIAQKYFK